MFVLLKKCSLKQDSDAKMGLFSKIIRGIGDFLDSSCDDEIVLRSVTCLANILSALRNRWQNRHRSQISTAEVRFSSLLRNLTIIPLIHISNPRLSSYTVFLPFSTMFCKSARKQYFSRTCSNL